MVDEFAPLIEWLKVSFDKSSLSGWILVLLFAAMWYKGLPALLDAFTKRADVERQRAKEAAEISAKDREETRQELVRLHQLHLDCEEARRKDREESDKRISSLYKQVDDLRCDLAKAMEKIAGLTAAKAQQQVSTAHLLSGALPDNEGVRLVELAAKASQAMNKAGK